MWSDIYWLPLELWWKPDLLSPSEGMMRDLITFSQSSRCWSAAATVPLCCPVWRRESGDGQSNTGSPPRWAWKAGVEPPRPPWVSLSTPRTPYLDLTETVDKQFRDPGFGGWIKIYTQTYGESYTRLTAECDDSPVVWLAGRFWGTWSLTYRKPNRQIILEMKRAVSKSSIQ